MTVTWKALAIGYVLNVFPYFVPHILLVAGFLTVASKHFDFQ